MWTRAELKSRGKMAFKRNYWSAVVVGLVMAIFGGVFERGGGFRRGLSGSANSIDSPEFIVVALIVAAIVSIVTVGSTLISIFIGSALMVGGCRFFILNQSEEVSPAALGYVFKSGNYGNVILTMFLRKLFIVLWSLLFVIPGIIKHYEYRMIPYILAENPGMDRREAFLISKKMMMGQKWDVFVLDLSFIGWRFLEGLTLGIVGIFYVEPYIQATDAELYTYNRSIAYQNGYIR